MIQGFVVDSGTLPDRTFQGVTLDIGTFLRSDVPRIVPTGREPGADALRPIVHSGREILIAVFTGVLIFMTLFAVRDGTAALVEAIIGTLCFGLCAGVVLRVRSVQRVGVLRDGLYVRAMIVKVDGEKSAKKRIELRFAHSGGTGSAVMECSPRAYRTSSAFGLGAELDGLILQSEQLGFVFPKGSPPMPIKLL